MLPTTWLMPWAMCRVDGVLGDVALGAEVVVLRAVTSGSAPRCDFILSAACQVRDDDLADAAHRLAVAELIMLITPRSCRMSSAAMVSLPDAALGESHVFSDRRRRGGGRPSACPQVFVERVDACRAWWGWSSWAARWGCSHHADDVRRVAAARALGMEGRTWVRPFEGRHGVFEEATLVQRIGVNGDLDVHPASATVQAIV
jgi:hypothetical protein